MNATGSLYTLSGLPRGAHRFDVRLQKEAQRKEVK